MKAATINETTKKNCIRLLQDPDYVRDNVYIGFQRASNATLIKRPGELPGSEQYLYVRGTDGDLPWHVRLQNVLLEDVYLTEAEAYANTCAEGRTVIHSLPNLLLEIGGPDIKEEAKDGPQMYVITNPQRAFGAAQILDRKVIRAFFHKQVPGCEKLIVIPSSIHECILVPLQEGEDHDINAFHMMVQEVNASSVDAKEQLADRCFEMRL